jgi:hypothetical protein
MRNLVPGWLVPPTAAVKPLEPELGSGLDLGTGRDLGTGLGTGSDLEAGAD